MAKEYAKGFYKSTAWKKTRVAYVASVFAICERCGGVGEILHHKKYITPENINDTEITLSWENLELLCQDCHNKEHMSSESLEDGLGFDKDGNLIRV